MSSGGPAPSDTVRRAQDGDPNAFAELYEENVGHMYALCLRMTGNPATAEELTQEAFVRAWEKLSSFRGASKFSTWMHRLTVNVVLSDRRATGRRRQRIIETDDLVRLERPRPPRAPGKAVDLEEAIADLPDGARQVFVLHEIEGYKHAEIAEMIGIATGTSKAQLHRARKLLRRSLRR